MVASQTMPFELVIPDEQLPMKHKTPNAANTVLIWKRCSPNNQNNKQVCFYKM